MGCKSRRRCSRARGAAPAGGEEYPVFAVGRDVHVDAGHGGRAGGGAEDDGGLPPLHEEAGETAVVGAVRSFLRLAWRRLEQGEGGGVGAADVVWGNAVTRQGDVHDRGVEGEGGGVGGGGGMDGDRMAFIVEPL